jgi:hypothetical protein
MATGVAAQLRDFQRLLKEGRPTEADQQLDTLATELERKAQEELMSQPAPGPKTPEELTLALYDAIAAAIGYPPRVEYLLTELKGALKQKS